MTKSVFTDAYKMFLELMVETRKNAGVHQSELAERIGWDQPKISHAETGVRRLDVIEFIAIAKALNVDPAELIGALANQLPDDFDI